MSKPEVIKFLKDLAADDNLKNTLKQQSKDQVLSYAQNIYKFSEREFDDFVWGMENYLAAKRGEKFDLSFSLWSTMWGRFYLEFVIDNVLNSLTDQDLEKIAAEVQK
jgi:hypothetical protein